MSNSSRVFAVSTLALLTVVVGFPAAAKASPPPRPTVLPTCESFSSWTAANDWFQLYELRYRDIADLDPDDDDIPCESLPGAPEEPVTPRSAGEPLPAGATGYWMLSRDGDVFRFGEAADIGGVTGPAVGIASASGQGAWVLTEDGRVSALGEAKPLGHVDIGPFSRGEVVSSISATPDGLGYWVFTNRGRVVAFGTAGHFGDTWTIGIAEALVGPVIASVPTPTGLGYYMLGSDGGVFTFGDATFAGSVPEVVPVDQLAAPLTGLAPDPDGIGYWLIAADGGLFGFDADFRGSVPGVLPPGTQLNRPVIGGIAYEDGYLMVASDGGIFNFSSKEFRGSLGFGPPSDDIVGVASLKRDPVVSGTWQLRQTNNDGPGAFGIHIAERTFHVEEHADRSISVSITSEACGGTTEVGTLDVMSDEVGIAYAGTSTMLHGDCGSQPAVTVAIADTSGPFLTICSSVDGTDATKDSCQALDRARLLPVAVALDRLPLPVAVAPLGATNAARFTARAKSDPTLADRVAAARRRRGREAAYNDIKDNLNEVFGPALGLANLPVPPISAVLTPVNLALTMYDSAFQAGMRAAYASDLANIPAPTPEFRQYLNLLAYRQAMLAWSISCLPFHSAAPSIGVGPWLACVSFPNGELVRTAFLSVEVGSTAHDSLMC